MPLKGVINSLVINPSTDEEKWALDCEEGRKFIPASSKMR